MGMQLCQKESVHHSGRSASQAINISNADEDSDVDFNDGDSESGEKSDENQRESDFNEQPEAKPRVKKTTASKANESVAIHPLEVLHLNLPEMQT